MAKPECGNCGWGRILHGRSPRGQPVTVWVCYEPKNLRKFGGLTHRVADDTCDHAKAKPCSK